MFYYCCKVLSLADHCALCFLTFISLFLEYRHGIEAEFKIGVVTDPPCPALLSFCYSTVSQIIWIYSHKLFGYTLSAYL